MLHVFPSFYPSFHCIASRCTDNCCIGWEIDIDPKTAASYRQLIASSSPLSGRLQEDIGWEDPPHFLLRPGDRCPFLNAQNLCDLQLALGEDALCEICTEHPRFHDWFGEYKESGLGLCCEEAARLLLTDPDPFALQARRTAEAADTSPFDQELLQSLLSWRSAVFALLLDESLPLGFRLQTLLAQATLAQQAMDSGHLPDEALPAVELPAPEPFAGRSCLSRLLCFLSSLEPIDPNWPSQLQQLDNALLAPPAALPSCARVCGYTLYRYLLKASRDGELLPRVKFAVCFALVSSALAQTAGGKLENCVEAVKAFSKELEYSEENLDAFLSASWEEEFLSVPALCALSGWMAM